MNAPVDLKNIRSLVRALACNRNSAELRDVLKTKTHDEHLLLCAPATIARCIRHAGFRRTLDKPVRVLLLDNTKQDFIDGGQWLRYVPQILGLRFAVELYTNTPNGEKRYPSHVRHIFNSGPQIKVINLQGPAGELVEQVGHEFDIAVTFNNILASNPETMPILQRLAAWNKPIYLVDMADIYGVLNRTIASMWGLNAQLIDGNNRFGSVPIKQRMGERWASVISQLSGPVTKDDAPDTDEENCLLTVGRMILHSIKHKNTVQIAPIGSPVREGAMIHTMDGLAVDEQRRITDLESGREMGRMEAEAQAWIDIYDTNWGEADRIVWAAMMKAQLIQAHPTGAAA